MKKVLFIIYFSFLLVFANDDQSRVSKWLNNFDNDKTWTILSSYSQGNFLAGFRNGGHNSEFAKFTELKIHFIRDIYKKFGYGAYLGKVNNYESGKGECYQAVEVKKKSQVTYGSVYAYLNGKYFGFKLRILAYEQERAFCQEADFGKFFLPTFELKLGLINKLYLKYSVLEEALLYSSAFGIVYNYKKYFNKIEILKLSTKDRSFYSLKIQLLVLDRLVLNSQIIVNSENKNKAFRIGIGYIFGNAI